MLPTKNITLNMDMLCQQDTYKVNLTPDTRVSSDCTIYSLCLGWLAAQSKSKCSRIRN